MKKIQKYVSLAKYTTLGIGGPAKYYIEVKSVAELKKAVKYAEENSLKVLIIGGGSNLLIGKGGFDGLVINNEIKRIIKKKDLVVVESGEVLEELIAYLNDQGLAGMEKMAGIPGSVGGALRGNAGAYGQTISDSVVRVKILEDGKLKWITNYKSEFGYRDSIYKQKNLIILGAEFILREKDKKELKKLSEEIIKLRAIKYAPFIKTPGSFFKNVLTKDLSKKVLSKIPKDFIMYGKIPAGQLLEAVGANGKSLGGIKISDHHGNLFVNTGKGTAEEFCELSEKYALKVKKKFGIVLEHEVQLVECDEVNKLEELRGKHPEFVYEKFGWKVVGDDLIVKFNYKIKPDINFVHEITINKVPKEFSSFDSNFTDSFVFNIGLVELFSYWKVTASPIISINCGKLDDYQMKWWRDLLMDGMGQYFYENKINFTKPDFVQIKSSGTRLETVKVRIDGDGSLVAVGGGKDSVVSLEMVKNEDSNVGTFVVNPPLSAKKVIEKFGKGKNIVVERKLDKKIIELNKKGFLNGHIPFSATLAFIGSFCAAVFGYKNMVFSNEQSSNEENEKYLGKSINHQYSKTFDFEKKFREYNKKYLSDVNYYSLLRPLHELQIAKLFSREEKYFEVIRSCNVGQKKNKWCCECSKCLSTFLLLYPFFGEKKILKIFPKNMFNDESLKSLLLDLTQKGRVKPFECVGTKEELIISLYLSIKNSNQSNLPKLLKMGKDEIIEKEKNLGVRAEKLLKSWSEENFLPDKFKKLLKEKI